MNYGPLIFLAAFLAMGASWFSFVLRPQVETGSLVQTNSYPVARSGLAHQGLEVYRANGCAYCHSQQVRQSGTVCDLFLNEASSNRTAITTTLLALNKGLSEAAVGEMFKNLPQAILQGVGREAADAGAAALKKRGAKAEIRIRPIGPDIDRNWGVRRSVARDFLYDSPAPLGSQRVGPDLANVGVRNSDVNWHLLHLYAPQTTSPGSTMPPYRFLFEKRRISQAPAPDALALTGGLAPEPGYEIVPRPEARALVAYLVSLRADTALAETPVTIPEPPPQASTNAPATNSPAANPK